MHAVRLTHNQALGVMVLASLLWGTAGVVTRQLERAEGFEVTFWRSLFAGLSLLVLLPVVRAWDGQATRTQRQGLLLQWWGVTWQSGSFWVSSLCWSVMFTAFMLALLMTSVAHVLVLMAAGPLLTAVLSHMVLKQQLAARTWLAVAAAVLGIVYMFASQWWASLNDTALSTTRLVMGTLIALMVPVASAINWIVVQRSALRGESVDLAPAVMVGGLLSALYTGPFAAPYDASGLDVVWLAGLGAFQLAVPCVMSVFCARVLKAAEVSLLAQLEVIFGIGLVWWLAGESPAVQVLIGGSVVMLALVVNELLGWRDRMGAPRIQTLNRDQR